MVKRNVLKYAVRPAEVVIVLILIMFIVFFAQVIVTLLIGQYTYEKISPPKFPDDQQWRIARADKSFLPDGAMHLVRKIDASDNKWYTKDYTKEEIADVNGSILWQGIHKERPFKYLDWVSSPRDYAEFFSEQQMRRMFLLIPKLSGVVEVPVRMEGEIKEVWRYDFEGDVFVGYRVEGGLIGYLWADGFVTSKAQPFGEFKGLTSWTDEDPSSAVMLWLTKQRIYQIDFRSRTVETVFDSAQSDIESIRWHKWRPVNPKDRDDSDIQYRPLIDCLTADGRHHLIMREPNQIITVELPEQMRELRHVSRYGQWPKVDFAATSNAVFLKYHEGRFNPPKSQKLLEQYEREYSSKPRPQSLQLYKVAGDGKLELVNQFNWTKPAWEMPYPPDPREEIMKWASTTSPPMFSLLWSLFGDYIYELSYKGMDMMQGYATVIRMCKPHYNLLNLVLSAAMVAFTLWHGWPRRTSRSKLILWLIIVGAFNLAGLLTYLGLNHTPVIKCPACGKKRGLERFNCIRCGSPRPIPQRRPTDLILAN